VKRSLLIAVVLIAAYAIFMVQPPAAAQGNPDKIYVCHVPPGNPANAHVVWVDAASWNLGHDPHNGHAQDTPCGSDPTCAVSPNLGCPVPPPPVGPN